MISPITKATANRKSNPVRNTAGKSMVRVGLTHSKAICRCLTLNTSAKRPPSRGLVPAPMLAARDEAVRYDVACILGAIFIRNVVVDMLTPALAIPIRMCSRTSSGTVRACRSGRVVKVQPTTARKNSDVDTERTTLLPSWSTIGPHTRRNRTFPTWLTTVSPTTSDSGISSLSSIYTAKNGSARCAAKFHRNMKLMSGRKASSENGAARVSRSDRRAPSGRAMRGSGIRAMKPTADQPSRTAPNRMAIEYP